jgi:16S rRNA (uracil1498-N3)-methyltransferase
MATPAAGEAKLDRCFAESDAKKVGLLVGPEGGFSPAEVEQARALGVRCFSWGPRILSADTACVVLAALVLDQFV